jgi:hypothetical protein
METPMTDPTDPLSRLSAEDLAELMRVAPGAVLEVPHYNLSSRAVNDLVRRIGLRLTLRLQEAAAGQMVQVPPADHAYDGTTKPLERARHDAEKMAQLAAAQERAKQVRASLGDLPPGDIAEAVIAAMLRPVTGRPAPAETPDELRARVAGGLTGPVPVPASGEVMPTDLVRAFAALAIHVAGPEGDPVRILTGAITLVQARQLRRGDAA